MKRWWVISGGSVVAGVVIGAGIVGYLHAHRDDPVVASRGGSVRLSQDEAADRGTALGETTHNGSTGAATPPAPTPLPLRVTGSNEGSAQGGGTLGGGQVGSDEPARLPEPDEFEVYDQYTNSTTAMFQDIAPGAGGEAVTGKTAVVHYRGWLTDGRKFDESYARKQPFEFKLGAGSVIVGWEQGIYGMKAGGKRRLIVPSSVGYGAQEHNGIPANSLLVFDVELLEVK